MATIQELAKTRDGMPVDSLDATIKKVFTPVKEGEGNYGPWRVVNMILTDATGEIRASWWDCPDSPEQFEGHPVHVEAQQGAKGLWGAKVKHNQYNGKTSVDLDLKGHAVTVQGAAQATNGAPSTPAPAPQAKKVTGGSYARPGAIARSDYRSVLLDEYGKAFNELQEVEAAAKLAVHIGIAYLDGKVVDDPEPEPPANEDGDPPYEPDGFTDGPPLESYEADAAGY